MLDLWYKNAVIYCIEVDCYMDSSGDGIGDFRGLTDRLDHVENLGATCIWLLPFYPSPGRDNGYDITDFYGVNSRIGSPGDFVAFTRAARDRGLRVLVDLVVNHTSVDHPWFQASRSHPENQYRDWYVWADEEPANIHDGMVFPGVQEAVWTFDDAGQAWYYHRFYRHEPDLNTSNPAVQEEIDKIMGYWLQLGVSGFRIDAAPFLIEPRGRWGQMLDDPSQYLAHMRRFLSWRTAESVMLAEANVPLNEVMNYFGSVGERMQMVFNFVLNQHVFLALTRRDSEPVRRIMNLMPDLPIEAQWGLFLRNHDELDLGRLSTAERDEVFADMAPDPGMIAYQRGIRRRLAPMLGGDLARLKLAYSLLFALPGTPVLWYGEEIGMGEDLSLEERNSVRTPLQWTDEANAGFSEAPAERLIRPVIGEGPYGYKTVNIVAQSADPHSLLNFIRAVVRTRRGAPEIGWGEWKVLDCDTRVLGLVTEWRGNRLLTYHNLSEEEVSVTLEGGCVRDGDRMMPILCSPGLSDARVPGDRITLPRYGHLWLRPDGPRR